MSIEKKTTKTVAQCSASWLASKTPHLVADDKTELEITVWGIFSLSLKCLTKNTFLKIGAKQDFLAIYKNRKEWASSWNGYWGMREAFLLSGDWPAGYWAGYWQSTWAPALISLHCIPLLLATRQLEFLEVITIVTSFFVFVCVRVCICVCTLHSLRLHTNTHTQLHTHTQTHTHLWTNTTPYHTTSYFDWECLIGEQVHCLSDKREREKGRGEGRREGGGCQPKAWRSPVPAYCIPKGSSKIQLQPLQGCTGKTLCAIHYFTINDLSVVADQKDDD